MVEKVDNANLPAKLDLRRYFLEKYHAGEPPDVLDCCQGSGVIWTALRKQFAVRTYWGLDEKPKKGRLQLDSARVVAQPGWTQNVVDVDTYGSPWKHWEGIMANLSRPTTVFLTIGHWGIGLTDKLVFQALGIPRKTPPSIATKLSRVALLYCVTRYASSVDILEIVEAESDGTARYLGVRVQPKPKPIVKPTRRPASTKDRPSTLKKRTRRKA